MLPAIPHRVCKRGAEFVLARRVGHRVPVWAGAAIDAPPPFVLSFQLFEGEKSFESPAVHLTAGGEFRIRWFQSGGDIPVAASTRRRSGASERRSRIEL